MWILTPQQPGGETFYLLPGKEYVVGRKNCDILLASDQSISRSHAQLTVTDQTLTLKDTSKYGTFVNSQQLTAPVELSSGDNVTFGVFHSRFNVVFLEKPVVCSSCLDAAGKTSLSQALAALGGKLVNSWTPDCTHLAMPTVKVTIKTISALLCCRPIVKPEYFSELSRAPQQKSAPPKPESFVPEIDEPSLSKEDVNLATTPARKRLFTGKTFVFLTSKQLKRLGTAVSFGGGSSRLLEEGSLPRDLLESPHSCVVEVTTGSSQTLLPPSATEWANSVKSIIHRKGLRVITESEIGLAAIYASCEKYCNPSCLIIDSDPAQKVKPRIPSASLSQSVTVDETVLPAASQNITAYAVNTETSQRMEVCRVKKQDQKAAQLPGSKRTVQKSTSELIVEDTMSSSSSAADNTDSQRRKPDPKPKGFGNTNFRSAPSAPKTNGGSRTFLHPQSSQKQKTSPQTSPQKQSTLTNFFQPVNKKRPLEEESSDVMSAPKRPAPESSISSKDTNSLRVSKKMPSLPLVGPSAVSETPLESVSDLFSGRAEHLTEEPRSRKRKEMEEEIKMEELESIMSEDMDYLDDESPSSHGQKEKVMVHHGLAKQKQSSHTVESSTKKQRVHQEQTVGAGQRPGLGLDKERSQQNLGEQSDRHDVSNKTDNNILPNHTSSRPPKRPAASETTEKKVFEDDDASFIEDVELLQVDIPQPAEETKASLKPVQIKEEVKESKIDEDLPKKLLMVEFRSLTVTAPSKPKPKQPQNNGHAKNFKCFRKKHLPGAEGFPHIIGGSDLLVHNRGTNSDLDEWLKGAAEGQRQSKREETIGDDLFRYNPTKPTKRR
ncbi:nibrin isoform X2 [Xiphophorus hellerii]|uniref:nibrin isoform X2 n=1 Tax=Xiphophorus hellerii TaxID=8084 RepID=UPI0013B47303|nr:nibrin isoform X2 [Xiphophorus hellerii]